tara:strand:+ start:123 stop:875 length:753 start_codon:yes stop_codon:yes gene_type:complete
MVLKNDKIKFVKLLKIKFYNFNDNDNDFKRLIYKPGLFLFPSGPGLASIETSSLYLKSLKKANYVFFDSGYFVILLRIFKNIKVIKFSGYRFLKLFFNFLKDHKNKSIFLIDPTKKKSLSNKNYIKKIGLKNIYNYISPYYNPNNLLDKKLLKKIKKIKPNYIMTNIGGGTQEILGLYLKNNLNFKTTILCTGGAISYFTGDEAPINNIFDKLFLGWLIRIIFNPKFFLIRYLKTFKLLLIIWKNKVYIE